MTKIKQYNWEKFEKETKTNLFFALDIVDDFFGVPTDPEMLAEEKKERLIAFQEILRVTLPTALADSIKPCQSVRKDSSDHQSTSKGESK